MLPNIRILLYFTILHSLNFVSVKIERARKSGVAKIGWGEEKFGGLHAAAETRLIHINQSRNGRACLNAQIGARESDGQEIHAKFNFRIFFLMGPLALTVSRPVMTVVWRPSGNGTRSKGLTELGIAIRPSRGVVLEVRCCASGESLKSNS